MKFKLDTHEVVTGSPVTGGVHAWTRSGNAWEPLVGVLITVRVDGADVGTVTTDADGYALISHVAAEGEHVMKVVFAGDVLHKRAQRAQGFTVMPGEPSPAPAPEPEPVVVAPDAPVLGGASPSVALVHLEWTVPASDGGSAITGYRVYRGEARGAETFLADVGADALAFDDSAVTSLQTLYYFVTAVNSAGESVWSNEVEVGVQ